MARNPRFILGLILAIASGPAWSQEPSPYGHLSVSILFSEQAGAELTRFTASEQRALADTISSDLEGLFKSVSYPKGYPQKPTTDLVIVLDLLFSRRQSSQRVSGNVPGWDVLDEMQVDIGATIWSNKRSRIDSVRVSAVTPPFSPYGSSDERWPIYQATVESAAGKLREGFAGSTRLQTFASTGGRRVQPVKTVRRAPPEPEKQEPVKEDPRVSGPSVDKPTYKMRENSDSFAVVIGIEKYVGLPDAQFAERDARAMREHLLALGYPSRNIAFLTGAQASRAGITKNLETWLSRNVKERSTVFVYFSGHGAPDPVKGEAYLVPADGDPQYLEDTAYPVRRLYEKLDALGARRVTVALDTCFSGAGGRSVLPKGTRPLVAKVETVGAPLHRVLSLTASADNQISGIAEGQDHGLFTYFLLRALNETEGRGTAKDVFEYLLPRVQDEAKRVNRDQVPQLTGPAGMSTGSWAFR